MRTGSRRGLLPRVGKQGVTVLSSRLGLTSTGDYVVGRFTGLTSPDGGGWVEVLVAGSTDAVVREQARDLDLWHLHPQTAPHELTPSDLAAVSADREHFVWREEERIDWKSSCDWAAREGRSSSLAYSLAPGTGPGTLPPVGTWAYEVISELRRLLRDEVPDHAIPWIVASFPMSSDEIRVRVPRTSAKGKFAFRLCHSDLVNHSEVVTSDAAKIAFYIVHTVVAEPRGDSDFHSPDPEGWRWLEGNTWLQEF